MFVKLDITLIIRPSYTFISLHLDDMSVLLCFKVQLGLIHSFIHSFIHTFNLLKTINQQPNNAFLHPVLRATDGTLRRNVRA